MYFPQLRSFQAGTVEGSFPSVSKRLNMSKPTIIQQVQQFETVYEMEFFYRVRRRIELNEVGRILLWVTATDALCQLQPRVGKVAGGTSLRLARLETAHPGNGFSDAIAIRTGLHGSRHLATAPDRDRQLGCLS